MVMMMIWLKINSKSPSPLNINTKPPGSPNNNNKAPFCIEPAPRNIHQM